MFFPGFSWFKSFRFHLGFRVHHLNVHSFLRSVDVEHVGIQRLGSLDVAFPVKGRSYLDSHGGHTVCPFLDTAQMVPRVQRRQETVDVDCGSEISGYPARTLECNARCTLTNSMTIAQVESGLTMSWMDKSELVFGGTCEMRIRTTRVWIITTTLRDRLLPHVHLIAEGVDLRCQNEPVYGIYNKHVDESYRPKLSLKHYKRRRVSRTFWNRGERYITPYIAWLPYQHPIPLVRKTKAPWLRTINYVGCILKGHRGLPRTTASWSFGSSQSWNLSTNVSQWWSKPWGETLFTI